MRPPLAAEELLVVLVELPAPLEEGLFNKFRTICSLLLAGRLN